MQRVPPVLRFLAAQGAAFVVLLLLARLPALASAVAGRTWGWVAVDACVAVVLSMLLRLPWWWWPLAALLPVAVVASSASGIPWWGWGATFLLLALVYGGGVRTRVPLYLSNRAAVAALADLLPRTPGVACCDLGAGLGGPTIGIARARPDAAVHGVEASVLPWLVCRLRAVAHPNVQMQFGDIFAHALGPYDLVYAFLSPAPMPRLWEKVQREMRPGTLFVSNTFAVPGRRPERELALPGRPDARLLVYRIPSREAPGRPRQPAS